VCNVGIAQDFQVSGSTLIITGDRDADDLTVSGGALGEVFVTDSQGTEIDSFSGIRNIDIDLLGGRDLLTLNNLALDGGVVSARLGADEDDVVVLGLIDADLILDGETEDDFIDLGRGVTVTGDLDVYGGLRNDFINLNGAGVQGNLWVDAQAGDDELLYDGLVVDGRSRIDLGVGHDNAAGTGAIFGNDVEYIAGLGDDDVFHSTNAYNGDLRVDLRGGDDAYAERSGFVDGYYHVDGGACDDDFDDSGTVVIGSQTTNSV